MKCLQNKTLKFLWVIFYYTVAKKFKKKEYKELIWAIKKYLNNALLSLKHINLIAKIYNIKVINN